MKNKKNLRALAQVARFVAVLLCSLAALPSHAQTTELTTQEAKTLYKNITMHHVSVHDPSVVYDEAADYYYIIGSHRGLARTRDLQNWTSLTEKFGVVRTNGTVETITYSESNKKNIERAFRTNQTKQITKDGKTIDFGNFDAVAWACALPDGDGNEWGLDGVMWAPDIIWNPVMQKWCQYMGINGYNGNSVIVLMTADQIEGPWIYQGPVAYSGFRTKTDDRVSWKLTDLELVIGEQSTLPERYNKPTNDNGVNWGDWWPNNIDPSVFFDEQGELWLIYGSWSGGIWMLKLNKENGLRDYDVTYATDYSASTKAMTSDAYFGKRVAGGCYVSGEGPYVEHIGQYYYLFVSYGGFAPDGGYQMRVFRSENPDGPYVDCRNQPATYTSWQVNFGPNTSNRGQLLMSSYNQWGFQTVGECAQGHNSAIAAKDGRNYLVYHTKFNDGTYGHLVRVHQLFVNEKGWLVAAPFEYNGETQTDEQNASQQLYQASEIPGKWQLLVHKYGLNHEKMEEVLPVEIELSDDGTISGGAKGKWELVDGTTYIHLTIGGINYFGVLTEQQMEPTNIKALCFTALNASGVPVWGYKIREKYQLARQVNTQTIPVAGTRRVSGSIDLYNVPLLPGVDLQWTSSEPDIISSEGRYNPAGLTENADVQLTALETCGDYYWKQAYNVVAQKDTIPAVDYKSGMLAYYNFDASPVVNILNAEQTANLRRTTPAEKPELEEGGVRNGSVLHQFTTTTENRYSYAEMPNPYYGLSLDDGATIAFWVKPNDDNLWNCIWAFYNASQKKRFFMTPNAYLGYSDGTDYVDINHADRATHYLTPGQWSHIILTISPDNGISIYVNGALKASSGYAYRGSVDGKSISKKADVDFTLFLRFMQECPNFYLGYGSFWSSADMHIDDLMLYNRVLTSQELRGLYTLANRVYDFAGDLTDAIEIVENGKRPANNTSTYDLSGRKVAPASLKKGVYISNGKKIIVR